MYPNPPQFATRPHFQYWWIILVSLLISAWLIWLDPVINRDAIVYLRAADAYLQQGLETNQLFHSRAMLSICMATLHQLTGIPLLYAGLLITTVSYAILSVGFVATVRTLGGNRSVQLIAAMVVLSHPVLNDTRSSIMRDPAYLAFIILSLREMLLYVRQPSVRTQLRWLAYIVLATLFRFEGLFFAVLAPLALLFTRDMEYRLRHCLLLLLPQLLVAAAVAAGLFIYHSNHPGEPPLFPAIGYYLETLQDLPSELSTLTEQSAGSFLNFSTRNDAPYAVAAMLVTILLLNLCRAMTWPWVIVLVWGERARLRKRFRHDDEIILRAYVVIGLIYLALFVLLNRFMLERYCSQLVIIVLLYIPFILHTLWRAGRWRKYLVIALLLGMSADTLHNGERDKLFIARATHWVATSTPEDSSLASNHSYIAYFSEREFNWDALRGIRFSLERILTTPRLWKNEDYLVMYLKPRQEQQWRDFLAVNSLQELRSFPSDGPKGRVAIVRLTPESGASTGPDQG